MQRAAAGLAAVCAGPARPRCTARRVVLLVGSGDNGGDALYAGARLARRGARVEAVLAGSRTHAGGAGGPPRGRAAAVAGRGRRSTAAELDRRRAGRASAATGALREPYAPARRGRQRRARPGRRGGRAQRRGREQRAGGRARPSRRSADGDLGGPQDRACSSIPARGYAGRVELVDIGLGPYLPGPRRGRADPRRRRRRCCRGPAHESDKYRRGVVGIAAGSDRYTGAAVLAVGGALRAGAGMVRYAGPGRAGGAGARPLARGRHHELRPGACDRRGRPRAGVGARPRARHRRLGARAGRQRCWPSDVPVLVDADGLTLVAKDRALLRRTAPVLITPHAGELSRLLECRPGARSRRRGLEHVRAGGGGAGRDRAAQGLDHGRGRGGPAGAGQPHRHARGWPPAAPATCSSGSRARCWPRA